MNTQIWITFRSFILNEINTLPNSYKIEIIQTRMHFTFTTTSSTTISLKIKKNNVFTYDYKLHVKIYMHDVINKQHNIPDKCHYQTITLKQ